MPEGPWPVDPGAARAAAAEVFVHCFPPMVVDLVRRAHPMGFHQFQLVAHDGANLAPGLVEDDPRIVLTSAWIDVGEEPVVLRLPHTHGRYFNLTLIDAAGEPFESLGSRTGDDAGMDLALVGPDWRGELPSGVRAKRAPSDGVWAVSRIHAHSPLDRAEAVSVAQRQWLALLRPEPTRRRAMATLEPPPSPCVRLVAEMAPATYFQRLQIVLARAPEGFCNAVDEPLAGFLRDLAGPPDSADWPQEFAEALARGFADGMESIRGAAASSSGADRLAWRTLSRGLGDAPLPPLARAARIYASLGAPVREDLLTLICQRDATDRALSSAHAYRIRFGPDALPPVDAFWRLTAGPGDAHSALGVGDRSNLALNSDGSLDIYIQSRPPRLDRMANWLPAPDGAISLVMRLYSPRSSALDGDWRMPPVERVDSGTTAERGSGAGSPSRSFRSGADEFLPAAPTWRIMP